MCLAFLKSDTVQTTPTELFSKIKIKFAREKEIFIESASEKGGTDEEVTLLKIGFKFD